MSSKKIIYIFSFILFLYGSNTVRSQEIKPEKVYLLFTKNDSDTLYYTNIKFANKSGINFNLNKEALIHKENHSIDTLSIEKLGAYDLVKESDLKKREKKWRKENEKLLKKYFGGVWVIDRNGVFDPYIIERIGNEKIIIYQVDFRNEGVID